MRILLVDDEMSFRTVLGDVLTDHGYEVTRAEDGGEARELADSQIFDLVISDIFMPTLNGLELHSHIRKGSHSPEVPFIFLSGFARDGSQRIAHDPRRDFFLSKTSSLEEIVACIERARVS